MPAELDELLRGLSVYQDIVLAGRTERRGERDCEERWTALAPHLPADGSLLDVGANFAWFCLRWCREGADRIAVAWEADLRSAAVARYVLESNTAHRVCLITARADTENLELFAQSGQRFSAALCLSVLHWLPDHRTFLRALGSVTPKIFIEHCNPREEGAGIEQVRREIGSIGEYLRETFPERSVQRLAVWKSHLTDEFARELWSVEEVEGDPTTAVAIPPVAARPLLELDPVWPPHSWWLRELKRPELLKASHVAFTPQGLTSIPSTQPGNTRARLKSLIAQMPRRGVTTLRRRVHRLWLALLRRLRS
ncbi:MAG: hypothetical protein C0483_17920 [Pirellula sp.]|nr:hypothetical protein [Pirellula sp.]